MAASPEIRVRKGRAEDLDAIAEIQAGSPEAARWNPGEYLEHDLRVAEVGGQVAGFLVSRPVAEEEGEILNVAVAPAFRQRGVGRALVENLLQAGPGELFLEVRESNGAARSFYEALGFKWVGRRPRYYDCPSEDAVVMNFRSCYCQGRRRVRDGARRRIET